MKISSNYNIETSEGVVLSAPLADPTARAYAFVIDMCVITVTIFALSLIFMFTFSYGAGVGMSMLIYFLLTWGYFIIGEVYFDGSSFGKKTMKIRVVTDELRPVQFTHSIIRNLLRVADALPGMYGFGLIAMLFNKDNKRLGDMAAGTIVISKKQYIRKYYNIKLDEAGATLALALSNEEKSAIVDLAFYCETGAVARAEEIAANLRPFLNNQPANVVLKQLRLFAKWILGQ